MSSATTVRIPPALKWAGGQYYCAREILARFPPKAEYQHYCEPYFGGGAVLFAHDPTNCAEVVNDLSRDLSNFWRVLRDEALWQNFVHQVDATPFSEVEYHKAVELLGQPGGRKTDDLVAWAHAFFVANRQSLAGNMQAFTSLTRSRLRRGMSNEVSAWWSAVEGLPAVHERLKRVVILDARPALEVIRKWDVPGAVQYLDPPWPHGGRVSTAVYAHEMTDADHLELLDLLLSLSHAKVLLSSNDNAIYTSRLFGKWQRHTIERPNAASHKAEKGTNSHVLWCNF